MSLLRRCRRASEMTAFGDRPGRSSQSQSFPWPALAETPQREQDLTSLPPKRGLIAAQPIEGIGRQVGKADKGAREIVGLISCLHGRPRTNIEIAGGLPDGVLADVVDDVLALLMAQSSLSEVQQVASLNLEQAALDRGGTAQ